MLVNLPPKVLEEAVAKWAQNILGEQPTEAKHRGVALDGKSLCGTLQSHGHTIHLLSLMEHASGGVLAQLKMSPKTNEHRTAMLLLKSLVLDGMVITGDAMFCQRKLCEQIVDAGGDYLFTVKDNQPELNKTIKSDFNPGLSPPYSERLRRQQLDEVREVDKGHGRIEIRHLFCSSRLRGYLNWPGFAQAIRIERTRIIGDKRVTDVSHAITSLGPDRANAKHLLDLNRGHWGIENRLHWVRDVTMGEDKCRARSGYGPVNFASLRNASLTLLRTNQCKAIASALRTFATKPNEILKILSRFKK